MSNSELCKKNATQPTTEEIQDNVPNILQMMGVESCKSAAAAGGSVFCGCAGGAKLDIGCEQISVISSKYLQTKNISMCILNSVSNDIQGSVVANNKVYIKLTDYAQMKCENGLTVDQSINVRFVNVNSVTTEVKNDLVAQIQDFIKNTMQTLQDSKTGYLATPQGQKSVQDALTQVNSNIESVINNTTVTSILSSVFGENEVTIEVGGHAVLEGSKCNITQDSIIDFAVQNMIQSAMTNVLNLSSMTSLINDMKNDQENKATGLDGLMNSMIIIIVLVLCGLALFGGASISSVMKYIIPLSVVVSLVFAIYFGINSKWVPTGICSGAIILLIIFEVVMLKRPTSKV